MITLSTLAHQTASARSSGRTARGWLSIITVLLACAAQSVGAEGPPPLKMSLAPLKQIYTSREGLVMKLTLTAQARTKVCLAKDALSQMQFTVTRAGQGRLALKPLIIKDNSQLFQEPMRVLWLESGQELTLRINLKRFELDGDERWKPGEYRVSGAFNLCEQTPSEQVDDLGKETPVKAVQPAWFMIMS